MIDAFGDASASLAAVRSTDRGGNGKPQAELRINSMARASGSVGLRNKAPTQGTQPHIPKTERVEKAKREATVADGHCRSLDPGNQARLSTGYGHMPLVLVLLASFPDEI